MTCAKLLLVAAVLGVSMVTEACSSGSNTSGAGGDRPASFIIGPRTLGGLAIAPDTSFRRMRRFFTSPSSATFKSGGCRLRFREIGLFAEFMSFDGGVGTPATCGFFLSVVATAPEWHTAKGLRVGATLRSLRRAYPRAYRSGEVGGTHWGIPTGAIRWELAAAAGIGEAAHPILVAHVKQARVAALGIETLGH